MKIKENMFVAIDYCLTLESGEEVDRSAEGEPLDFIIGAGQIIPGLEDGLIGMKVGDQARITVAPADAYGELSDELLQEVPRDTFPPDIDIQPGMEFEAEGPHGPFMFRVQAADNQVVVADLNHPLAGETLHFDIKVLEVREASAEELAEAEAENEGCGCGCADPDEAEDDCDCMCHDEGSCDCSCVDPDEPEDGCDCMCHDADDDDSCGCGGHGQNDSKGNCNCR